MVQFGLIYNAKLANANTPITSKCCNLKSKLPTENNFWLDAMIQFNFDTYLQFIAL